MKQYLSIILRNQFNLFYRFGYTFIPKLGLLEFSGNITNEIKEGIVKQFATTTPFDYDEEYLILHLEKPIGENDDFIQFEIQDVIAIYPLSQQAKESIESKIDERIRIEEPVFESVLPKIELEIQKKEIENAISAIWTIFRIREDLEKYVSSIGIEHIFKGLDYRKIGTKAKDIGGGNYWEYLIAYDRFDYFPKSTLGFFYDAGEAFAYFKGQSSINGSELHKFLEVLKERDPEIKAPDIIELLKTEEQVQKYVSQTSTNNIKQYIIAPLYLMLRDEIRDSDEDITKTKLFIHLDYLKEFGDSFNYVLILLGAFFGFRKFYDAYYDALNLRFYKDYKEKKKETTVDFKQIEKKITEEKPKGQDETALKEVKNTNASTESGKPDEQTLEAQNEEKKTKEDTKVYSKQRENQVKGAPQYDEDTLNVYRTIIDELLDNSSLVKLKDIASEIKLKEKKKEKKVKEIENIIEELNKKKYSYQLIKERAKAISRKENDLLTEK